MPRSARHAPGGHIYHALNRAVVRLPLFKKDRDYVAFLSKTDFLLPYTPIQRSVAPRDADARIGQSRHYRTLRGQAGVTQNDTL
jgi:hypothetical protein